LKFDVTCKDGNQPTHREREKSITHQSGENDREEKKRRRAGFLKTPEKKKENLEAAKKKVRNEPRALFHNEKKEANETGPRSPKSRGHPKSASFTHSPATGGTARQRKRKNIEREGNECIKGNRNETQATKKNPVAKNLHKGSQEAQTQKYHDTVTSSGRTSTKEWEETVRKRAIKNTFEGPTGFMEKPRGLKQGKEEGEKPKRKKKHERRPVQKRNQRRSRKAEGGVTNQGELSQKELNLSALPKKKKVRRG